MSKLSTKSVPLVPVTDTTLLPVIREWKEISEWMEKAKKTEKELREKIAAFFFPKPIEGVNKVLTELDGQQTEIVLDFKINRSLDAAVLDSVMGQLPEDSPYRQADVLITYKPSLVLKGFRTLPDDQRMIFSQALTETPGLPGLHINPVTEGSAPETAPAKADWPAQETAVPKNNALEELKIKSAVRRLQVEHPVAKKAAPKSAAGKAIRAVQSSRSKKR